GLFLIDGQREIQRAIQSGGAVQALYGTQEELETFDCGSKSRTHGIPLVSVSAAVLEKIMFGERESLVAVAAVPEHSLHHYELQTARNDTPLFAVLEQIEKPGNIGAVFRSADGAGLDGVILADELSDLYNPAVIRNSMGTVFNIPAAVAGAAETLNYLNKHHIRAATARCEAVVSYTDYDFRQPTAIVLGNEANGLSAHWYGENITAVSLPMLGIADSLNISNAAAVLFYEARRQRRANAAGSH
ncbi:MAG: hypothetical protein LBN39_03345, partial [Planctomycetaceae bacterium]|nr:hypothetical protein [Planctomycetaceae bacterium]